MTPSDRSVEGLLAQQDFVRGLARQLLGEHEADDLTQDAFLHTLRSDSRVEAPRPWLATVVRRLASNRRRDHGRRVSRERAIGHQASPTAPSTASILACEEARRQVVEAVLGLDEPYRGTVLARYYEGLDTTTIAARDDVAEATVRSRLRRGLDRLRLRLDQHHDGRREGWAAPLALLVGGAESSGTPAPLTTTGRTAMLAATLVGVAAVVWAVAGPTSGSAAGPSAGSGLDPLTAGSAQAATGPNDRETGTDLQPDLQRVAVGQSPALPKLDVPVDDVEVRVIDDATHLPVAGAVIHYLPVRVDVQHPTVRNDPALAVSIERDAFVRTHGMRTIADANGLATIRLPRIGARVLAEHEGRRRLRSVVPRRLMPGERVELALRATRSLRFRLVDPISGEPVAGRNIQLRWQGSSPLRDPIEIYDQGRNAHVDAGPSDAEGRIDCNIEPVCRRLLVRVKARGKEAWQPIDLAAALAGIVEVPCAPTGSLAIELQTPSGQRWPAPIAVELSHEERRVYVTGDRVSVDNAEPGRCRIPDLELGATWRVRANPMGFYRDGVTTTVRGPEHAGDERTVVLTAAYEPCVVEATLQLAPGVPPSRSTKIIVSRDGSSFGMRSWCDDAGRVLFCVPVGKPAEGVIAVNPRFGFDLLSCRWKLAAPATAGRHAIGPLVLSGPPAVVAGRIDVGDQPWHGAPLTLRLEAPDGDDDWFHVAFAQVHPTDSPQFRIAGHTDAERLRVSVLGSRHHLPVAPAIVEPGTDDLRLVVDRGLPLRVRVLAPAAYAAAVRCLAVPEDGSSLPPYTFENFDDVVRSRGEAVLVDGDGESSHFAWPSLPAGTYRVEVFAAGMPDPLAVIPGVDLAADTPPDDRLDPVDLTDLGRTLTVRIDAKQLAPFAPSEAGVLAWASDTESHDRHGLLFDHNGTAPLLVGPGPVDLLVIAPGHRIWRRTDVKGAAVTVDLEPCHQPSFRLADAVAERLRGHRVQMRLVPWEATTAEERARWQNPATGEDLRCSFYPQGRREGAVGGHLSGLRAVLGTGYASIDNGATGELTVPVADTGTYRLELRVGRADGKGWASGAGIAPLESLQPSTITITGEEREPFVIEVDEAELTEALEYLGAGR